MQKLTPFWFVFLLSVLGTPASFPSDGNSVIRCGIALAPPTDRAPLPGYFQGPWLSPNGERAADVYVSYPTPKTAPITKLRVIDLNNPGGARYLDPFSLGRNIQVFFDVGAIRVFGTRKEREKTCVERHSFAWPSGKPQSMPTRMWIEKRDVLALSSDGKYALGRRSDGNPKVLEVFTLDWTAEPPSAACVRELPLPNRPRPFGMNAEDLTGFSDDGRFVFWGYTDIRKPAAHGKFHYAVFEASSAGEALKSGSPLAEEVPPVTQVSLSGDLQWLAIGFDEKERRPVVVPLHGQNRQPYVLRGLNGPVSSLSFSAEGKYLAATYSGEPVLFEVPFFDPQSGTFDFGPAGRFIPLVEFDRGPFRQTQMRFWGNGLIVCSDSEGCRLFKLP